uniref:Baculoviral IAP repeat-containing protein 7-A n=1 Tax=Phallusia mammillata TaxID=59560 RepID=A0A6F9D7D9_9ASCI|nr:baculoviral IAP repeat-containing protein 7-A [Phallusia mammillata]
MEGNSHNGEITHLSRCSDSNQRHNSPDPEGENLNHDGIVNTKQRDPPGQKSVYILPGDTEREVYRMTTFKQFPQHVPVDPVLLARSGFYYSGYKDRVKCFSCGIAIDNWVERDDPRSKQWHTDDCKLANGSDERNVPISAFNIMKDLQPQKSSLLQPSMDSGYGSSNASCSSAASQNSNGITSARTPVLATDAYKISQSINQMSLNNEKPNNKPSSPSNAVPMETSRSPPPPAAHGVERSLNEDIKFATVPSSRHLNLLNSLDLCKEDERRKSFADWPTTYRHVSTEGLAKSGFFYLGNLDRTQCFSCAGVLRNWSPNDVINAEHRRHFPHCKMMMGNEERNIKSNSVVVSNKPLPVEPPNPDDKMLKLLETIFPLDNAISPHMRNVDSRFETFDQRWPSHRINSTKMEIAKAGFFFLGERDRAKCWYCNGGLQNWDSNDEPWTEHAKWFPGCAFVLRHKGVDFVRKLVAKFPNIKRPGIRNPRDEYKPGVFEQQIANITPVTPLVPARPSAGSLLSSFTPPSVAAGGRSVLSDAINSEFAGRVVAMGFSKRKVETAIKQQVNQHQKNFSTAEELLDAVLQLPDEDEDVENSSMEVSEQPQQIPVHEANIENKKRQNVAISSGEVPSKIVKTSTAESSELQSLVNERQCKTCFNEDANTMSIPCGHLGLCENCATSAKKCKVCNRKIESTLKTFRV